ncbi:MAG: hypothetical protein QMC95_06530 [Desulfitobacteriaceae bacterium]|nr:hypothetical protein [Desulfitobacteriaceae bacterium]
MAKEKEASTEPVALEPIEKLAQELCSPSVFTGMKHHYGWADGLSTTREEFIKARDAWLKTPVSGNPKGGKK